MAKYCTDCGARLTEGARYCTECGAQVQTASTAPHDGAQSEPQTAIQPEKPKRKRKPTAQRMMKEGRAVTPNITLCEDGKYRWVYEVGLFRNPTVFLLVWKIFSFIFLGIFAMVMLFDTLNGYMDGERLMDNLKIMVYAFLGMTAVVALGYALYAAIMGGKYIVIFEMDDEGVNHKQLPKQARKAQKIGQLAVIAGASAHSFGAMSAGMGAQRTEMYSEFSKVRKLKLYPRRHLIKLNGLLSHNQVYAADEDFGFVKEFVISRCNNIKNKEKII